MAETDRDDETGRFLPGNRFWTARSSHGAKPRFEDPEGLWSACCEYFEWNEDNPLNEAKAFAFQGVVTVKDVPVAFPYQLIRHLQGMTVEAEKLERAKRQMAEDMRAAMRQRQPKPLE